MSQPQFGIKQTIRLEWVIHTAQLYQQGLQPSEIRTQLAALLEDRRGTGNVGTRSENTRDFVIANLMRMWVTPLPQLEALRDAASALMTMCSTEEAHAINWGLILATYPFWYHIARHTGRLLTLQGTISQKQLTMRLGESYGATQTVSRYSQYIMRSFTAWGVILDTDTQGTYSPGPVIVIENPAIVGFLYESVIRAENKPKPLVALQNDPAFFPYTMPYIAPQVLEHHNARVIVQRFGSQDDIVMVR